MITLRLKMGNLDRRTGEFEETDAYDLEPSENINDLLDTRTMGDTSDPDHAVLEMEFPMGEMVVATFSKRQTKTKKGKKKVRWYID